MAMAGRERTTIVKVLNSDSGRRALAAFVVGLAIAGATLAATATAAAPGGVAAATQPSAAARPAAQRGMQIQVVS
ncbi:MAG TPA: hypothetical protein VFS60_17610, partial [Thermoanaerobaculia bacterium]|nr:hypothetical protein [Thermoanaerobaculia bacterium]